MPKAGGVPNGIDASTPTCWRTICNSAGRSCITGDLHHQGTHRFCAVAAGIEKAAVPVCGAGFRLNPALEQLRACRRSKKPKVGLRTASALVRLHRAQTMLRGQPSEFGRGLSDHRAPPRQGLPLSRRTQPRVSGADDLRQRYLPAGFSQFKIEGRGLAVHWCWNLLYLDKAGIPIAVREAIYLDNMLDLFRKLHRAERFLSGAVFTAGFVLENFLFLQSVLQ